MNCESCRFYRKHESDPEIGSCRRYAPRPGHEGERYTAGLLAQIAAAAAQRLPEEERYEDWARAVDRATDLIGDRRWAQWASVFPTDWCGEWSQ
jgi:hypothetical protein